MKLLVSFLLGCAMTYGVTQFISSPKEQKQQHTYWSERAKKVSDQCFDSDGEVSLQSDFCRTEVREIIINYVSND